MLAPINYKKRPILASLNVTGADGYLLVEIRGFEGSDLDASVIASASARRGSCCKATPR